MSGLRSIAVGARGGAYRVAALTVALAAGLAVLAPGPAMAMPIAVQDDPVEADGQPDAIDDEFDGRSTRDTVRLVVGSLIGIAAGTAVMMVVFVWHTSPRRRLRVATRRAERRRAQAAAVGDGNNGLAAADDHGLLARLAATEGSEDRSGDVGTGDETDDAGAGSDESFSDAEEGNLADNEVSAETVLGEDAEVGEHRG